MTSFYTLGTYNCSVQSEAPEDAMGPAEATIAPIAPAWLRACLASILQL